MVGYLGIGTVQDSSLMSPFRQGLGEAGFVEGKKSRSNIALWKNTVECPLWQLSWSGGRWPSLLRLPLLPHLPPRPRLLYSKTFCPL